MSVKFTNGQIAHLEGLRKRMPLGMKEKPLDEWIVEMVDRAFDAMAQDEQVYLDEEEEEEHRAGNELVFK